MKEKIEARLGELRALQRQKEELLNQMNSRLAEEQRQYNGVLHRIDELTGLLKFEAEQKKE